MIIYEEEKEKQEKNIIKTIEYLINFYFILIQKEKKMKMILMRSFTLKNFTKETSKITSKKE